MMKPGFHFIVLLLFDFIVTHSDFIEYISNDDLSYLSQWIIQIMEIKVIFMPHWIYTPEVNVSLSFIN